MHDATNRLSHFKLAIAPGVPSSRLSKLLALQRAEEPEVTIAFFEVTADDLVAGLREGRYDAGMSLQGLADPSLSSQPLWSESMAVALPLRLPLLDQATLAVMNKLSRIFQRQDMACEMLIKMTYHRRQGG